MTKEIAHSRLRKESATLHKFMGRRRLTKTTMSVQCWNYNNHNNK